MELHGYEYTWNELVVKTWTYQILVALLLVSCIAMTWFINTYEINQIHVTFYWVGEHKPRCYQYVIIASYAHLRYRLAEDDGMPNLLVTVIAYKLHWLHLISSHFCWHWFCISISVDMFLSIVILNIAVFVWNSDSHSCRYEQNMFFL